jgi:PAS domain S-box-containing protein
MAPPRTLLRWPILDRMYASTWSTPVALGLVVLSMLFLVAFPRIASRRVERLRAEITDVSGPARTTAGEVERALALEVAAVRGLLLSGRPEFRAGFDQASARETRATAELERLAGQLGGEVSARVADYRRHKGLWSEPILGLLEGRVPRDEYVARLLEQQRRFEDVVRRLHAVDAAIVASEEVRRSAIREAAASEDRMVVIAAVIGFLSAVAAAALTRRLRNLTRRARRRAQEEQELRHLARALSGAVTVKDVAQNVVQGLVATSRASAAYIELAAEPDVAVAAATGEGAPAVDTRVAYPGSLTEAMIEGRDPQIVPDLAALGAPMAPHVTRGCAGCRALVVPMFSDQEVLGALVLLRARTAPDFEEPDVAYVRIVGDLASAAVRRVTLLEQTQRERAALKASEEQFRALAENAQVAIFVIGEDDTIVFANPPVERIFGYKPSELVGQPLTILMPAALRPRHRAGVERHIATGRRNIPWEGVELPGIRKDGVEIPLEITMGEFVRDGRRYFTGIARDITERRRAEQEREDLLAREREARERAEAAIRTREEVLAIVSHDLRNPLNTIAMGATALRDFPGQDPGRYVDMIQRAIQRMNRLIEDLMDVVKLEGGQRLALDPAVVELPPMLGEMRESFQAQGGPRHQTVTCHSDPAVPPIVADRDRLLQVLSNLLGNAMKFTPEGGRVSIQARRVEGEVWISVADTGPGIPPDDLPRIFDPYWQARRTARLGAGLGLTISKGIVEAHGGRIWVESRAGEGSTFTFALPITGPQPAVPDAAPDEKAARPDQPPLTGGTKTTSSPSPSTASKAE